MGLALMRCATARRQATSDASSLLAPCPLVWTLRPSPQAKLCGRFNVHSQTALAGPGAEKVLHAVMDCTISTVRLGPRGRVVVQHEVPGDMREVVMLQVRLDGRHESGRRDWGRAPRGARAEMSEGGWWFGERRW